MGVHRLRQKAKDKGHVGAMTKDRGTDGKCLKDYLNVQQGDRKEASRRLAALSGGIDWISLAKLL